MIQPSAAANLERRLNRQLLVLAVYVLIVFSIGTMLAYLSHTLSQELRTEIQQQVNTNLSEDGAKTLQSLIRTHPETTQLLIRAIPNDTTFPELIATLENITKVYDPKSEIRVPSDKPVKIKSELTIPLQIKLSLSAPNFSDLLKTIEQLPYIIEVTGIDLQMPSGSGGLINCTLGVRVYVQDPFATS